MMISVGCWVEPAGHTILLKLLEPLLGLDVQVLQVVRPAPLDEHILLVVRRNLVVHGQPAVILRL